jgi:ribonuclease HI
MSNIVLHFDGSCGPVNPGGTAAYGFVVTVDGVEVKHDHAVIGTGPNYSNNYAEFYAVYKGLEYVNQIIKSNDMLFIKGDSKLVINILKKKWKVRHKTGFYYPAYKLAAQELLFLRESDIAVFLDWIPREDNTIADKLSKTK